MTGSVPQSVSVHLKLVDNIMKGPLLNLILGAYWHYYIIRACDVQIESYMSLPQMLRSFNLPHT